MGTLTRNTAIDPVVFLNRVKEICNGLLPADTDSYTSLTSNLPTSIRKEYLVNKSSLLSDIQSILDDYGASNYNGPIRNNKNILADTIFDLLKEVFKDMSRCRKVYYYDAGGVTPGTQSSPTDIANSLGLTGSAGKWTYFNKTFGWNSSDNRGYRVPAANNGNKNESGFETIPNNNWNYSTSLTAEFTPRVSTLNINNLIEALNTVETQFGNFENDWSNKNNSKSWWNGDSTTQNVSNKIFWCRYWCHNNCHSNCHGHRSRR